MQVVDIINNTLENHLKNRISTVFNSGSFTSPLMEEPTHDSDELYLAYLATEIDSSFTNNIALKNAFEVWSSLPYENRKTILIMFRNKFAEHNENGDEFKMLLRFCFIFLKDFVPVLSLTNN
jgi:hypothetical protein